MAPPIRKKTSGPTPISRDKLPPTEITLETTFDELFETKRLSIPIPVFVGLLPSLDNKEYLQPNVNHHYLNDGPSFQSLDSAFQKWVKEGTGTISTEFNAILMSEIHDKPKDFEDVAFKMFNVSSKSPNEKMFGEVEYDCDHLQKYFFGNISSYDYEEYYYDRNFADLKDSMKVVFGTNGDVDVSILSQHLSNPCSFLTEIKGSLLSWLYRWIA